MPLSLEWNGCKTHWKEYALDKNLTWGVSLVDKYDGKVNSIEQKSKIFGAIMVSQSESPNEEEMTYGHYLTIVYHHR